MDDAGWARKGRALADALIRFAHERGETEQRRVAELHTEICAERRAELNPPPEVTDA
jgi:hypothetical protein